MLFETEGYPNFRVPTVSKVLGLQRRRLYDSCSVLEAIGVVKRSAERAFSFQGFGMCASLLAQVSGSITDMDTDTRSLSIVYV
jgi:hypothetical protein